MSLSCQADPASNYGAGGARLPRAAVPNIEFHTFHSAEVVAMQPDPAASSGFHPWSHRVRRTVPLACLWWIGRIQFCPDRDERAVGRQEVRGEVPL